MPTVSESHRFFIAIRPSASNVSLNELSGRVPTLVADCEPDADNREHEAEDRGQEHSQAHANIGTCITRVVRSWLARVREVYICASQEDTGYNAEYKSD